MNRQAAQLITRAAINKIGNMLYDYGNSIWLASLGALGQTVLGIYQISELVTSILFNPFGGAIADRFSRRKVADGNRFDLCRSLFADFFYL